MGFRCFVERFGLGTIALPDAESKHARLSRRLSVGDELTVFDGQGRWGEARILAESKRSVEIEVAALHTVERSRPALTLAVAMPKGPRQDTLIEKCAELGVAEIIPLVADRSVSLPSDHKLDKWRRTMIEAAKQSGACWLPTLRGPTRLPAVLATLSDFGLALVAALPHDCAPQPISALYDRLRRTDRILGLVGPEGGWSDQELAMMESAGAVCVTLGRHTLRIETAAIVLAGMVHALDSDEAG